MATRYRFEGLTGQQCGCTVCGRVFGGPASFDHHRGIRARPRSDEAQDAGTCSLRGLIARGDIYLTAGELAVSDKMMAARTARKRGN